MDDKMDVSETNEASAVIAALASQLMPPPPPRPKTLTHIALLNYKKHHYAIIDSIPQHTKKCAMIHSLLDAHGISARVRSLEPVFASDAQMKTFHSDEYIETLSKCTTEDSIDEIDPDILTDFGLEMTCAPFEDLWDHARLTAGGSLRAAHFLIEYCQKHVSMSDRAPIAIHWLGGRHHAQKDEASGFCFVNDVVLASLHLLEHFDRILYIDIDVHHGDGVEQAFSFSPDVLTISFHLKEHGFFPGTGALSDVGFAKAKYSTVNVPLKQGITGEKYVPLFKDIVDRAVEKYDPDCIILVCGADSLAGDPLGRFSLRIEDMVECVKHVQNYHKPLLLLGGGGYNMPNTARMAARVTAALIGMELPQQIPHQTLYYGAYGVKDTKYEPQTTLDDDNTPDEIAALKGKILGNLDRVNPPVKTKSPVTKYQPM